MNRSIRILMITGISAMSLTLITAGVHAQQRMGRGDAVFFTAPAAHPGMGAGPMVMQGFGHGHMGEMEVMRMAERLGLTQDQRDRIGKIIDDTRPKLRKNGFDRMDNRKELHALMKEDKLDDKKLRSMTRRQGELMADMMYLQMKMRSDIHGVLTDEQRDKMKERNGKFFRRGMKGETPPMPGEDS
jgi:Spy/CpxP family protein refolding chaperone